jgi:5-formaminoimidazole-4-carboxamide-1-beta-D-ribofuranosyl 5'-monophosphate synthetase
MSELTRAEIEESYRLCCEGGPDIPEGAETTAELDAEGVVHLVTAKGGTVYFYAMMSRKAYESMRED